MLDVLNRSSEKHTSKYIHMSQQRMLMITTCRENSIRSPLVDDFSEEVAYQNESQGHMILDRNLEGQSPVRIHFTRKQIGSMQHAA